MRGRLHRGEIVPPLLSVGTGHGNKTVFVVRFCVGADVPGRRSAVDDRNNNDVRMQLFMMISGVRYKTPNDFFMHGPSSGETG